MSYVVYIHTNRVNGKAYVGWTSLTLEERWEWHCDDALHEKDRFIFHAAIRKYGIDAWDHKLLEMHLTEQDAKNAEVRLIAEHRTFCYEHPETGYNMTKGGEGLSGYTHRPNSKLKTSASLKGNRNGEGNRGRTLDAEWCAKIAVTLTGKKRPSDVTQKISTSLKSNTRGRGNRNKPLKPEHVEKLRLAARAREARKRAQREDPLS